MSRADKIFKEIVDEEKSQIDNIQMKTKKIHHYLIDMQKQILDYARGPCKDEFALIEKSGEVFFDDTGFKIKIRENNNTDADAKIGNFVECLSRHDLGMKEFFDKMNVNLSHINEQSNKCLDSCVNYDWEKTEIELKACMKKCITSSYVEFGNCFDAIEKKITEVSNKL
jgi:hypothetical protein